MTEIKVDLENGMIKINIDNDEETEDMMSQSPGEELEEEEVRLLLPINTAAKPPRPPKGPSLNAGDVKLMKEIGMIKRARVERLKAMRKKKEKIISSSQTKNSSNLAGMIITLLFFLVVIFQGCSGSHKT